MSCEKNEGTIATCGGGCGGCQSPEGRAEEAAARVRARFAEAVQIVEEHFEPADPRLIVEVMVALEREEERL